MEAGELTNIPALITDVYYLHEHKLFHLQVFFNKNLVFNTLNQNVVESFTFHYTDFSKLYIDWLYCFECIKEERFDISKHHTERVYVKEAAMFELKEEEKDATVVERNGHYYLVIRTDPGKGHLAFMNHTAYRDMLNNKGANNS